MEEEESFPRGGVFIKAKQSAFNETVEDEDLFKTKEEKKGKKRKGEDVGKKSKKQKIMGKEEVTRMVVDNTLSGPLTRTMISPGMLLLGMVKSVQDYSIDIGFANGITGNVPITNIADAYSDQLQKLANAAQSEEPNIEDLDVHSLHELFKIGMVMPCKVLRVPEFRTGHKAFKLTVNPKEINSQLSSVNIRNGLTLFGNVASQEDHGYVMDIGIPGLRAFLKNEDAEEFIQVHNDGLPLRVGQPVTCMVVKEDSSVKDNRSVNVTVDPKKIQGSLIDGKMKVTMRNIVPGMKMKVEVQKISVQGAMVKFFKFTGEITEAHLKPNISSDTEVDAVVLSVNPTTKVVTFTTLPHLVNYSGIPLTDQFSSLTRGTIIEEAVVQRLTKYGVLFKLTDNVKGFSNNKNLGDAVIGNRKERFPKGAECRCRVIDLDRVDNVAVVSLKESVLKQQFLVISDVKPGSIIKCKMVKKLEKGFKVRITDNIFGFIPNLHLADVPLKHPEKKFEEEKELKCLVLSVDTEKKKITLSNKKSLKTSKYPVLTSYNQLQQDMTVEGCICLVTSNGCLVTFCNDLKGWVARNELSTERINFPEKVFYVGQVVRCRVLWWSQEKNKISLSFKVPTISTSFGTKPVELPEDYRLGKLVDCKITSKTHRGLDVMLLPSEIPAFLPRNHLSDCSEDCFLLLQAFRPDMTIKDVVYIGTKTIITVSNRMSLKVLAKEDQIVTDFEQLEPGLMVPGSIKNLVAFGIFVELPGPLVGLVPSKFTTDKFVPELKTVYHPGQSIIIKVTEHDTEKQRFLGSLRMVDCYHGDTDIGLDMLSQHLNDMDMVHTQFQDGSNNEKKLGNLQIGQVHKVTITEVVEQGALCELPDGVKGLITTDHIKDKELKVGGKEEAIILYVDIKNSCVELSFCPTLIQHKKRGKLTQVKEGQLLKCDVLLVKQSFILVMLKGNGKGLLAYLPAKRHINDVLEVHQFCVGQVHPVIVKRIENGRIMCSMQVHESRRIEEMEGEHSRYQIESHTLGLGNICTAVINKIYPTQINLKINQVPGRLHITETVDELTDGDYPLSRYKEDTEIQVKIIGFRETKSYRFLPITHKNLTQSLPECSIRPSVLSRNLTTKDYTSDKDTTHKYKVGDKVLAYVQNYENHVLRVSLSPSTKGWVYFLNLTDDFKVLRKPEDHFLRGQGYHARVVAVGDKRVELSLTGKKEIVQEGVTTKAWITDVNEYKGLFVRLADGYKGSAGLTDLTDAYSNNPVFGYKQGQFVHCCVCSVNSEAKTCQVSLRVSRTSRTKQNVQDPEVQSLSDLSPGQILRGFVTYVSDQFHPGQLDVCVGRNITGTVPYQFTSDCKLKILRDHFYVGQCVTSKVVKICKESGKITLSLRQKDTGADPVRVNRKLPRRNPAPEVATRKHKLEEKVQTRTFKKKAKTGSPVAESSGGKNIQSDSSSESDSDSGVSSPRDEEKSVKPSMKGPAPRLKLSAAFSWDADLSIPQSGHVSSDEDSSDNEGGDSTKKTKKTKAEIRLERKEEEKRLFLLEQKKLSGEHIPQTVDDYDRLVVTSPNSSLVWLHYMAFHLESAEIDKARTVAERALKTISFREEQEKLNVWGAYLNLENMYGTPDQLKKVLDRALQQNDVTKVYNQMINIYIQSGKMQEAESLYHVMTRRRKGDKETWIGFGLFYYKDGRFDEARKLMQRSLQSLEKKSHVDVIAKFAQMEFKHGEAERGKTLFESILSNYPKRTDLWSVYIDMVIRTGDLDSARKLLERVIHLRMSTKQMKFFYKKYLDFEKAHGNSATVDAVKQKAMEYVESQGFVDD